MPSVHRRDTSPHSFISDIIGSFFALHCLFAGRCHLLHNLSSPVSASVWHSCHSCHSFYIKYDLFYSVTCNHHAHSVCNNDIHANRLRSHSFESRDHTPFNMKSFSPITILVATGLISAALALPRQHARHVHSHNEPGHESGYGHLDTSKRATSDTIALDSHVEYSSSMGVIGCLMNTNRIAYFPMTPPCSNPCIKLTAPNGNTINVLHIDQSGGSYDISMDAY